ncbi:MAG: Fic family protein [Bacillota bacterium]
MQKYIHQLPDWPNFHWRAEILADELAAVTFKQGKLLGRMETLGFEVRSEAFLQTLTQDVVQSSEIEGEILDTQQVRSSIARRLGIAIEDSVVDTRSVDGIVDVVLDATQNYDKPLTKERLFAWHAALFPTTYSGLQIIRVGKWRDDKNGPMQVVSGPMGREKVHFEAPEATRVDQEMTAFLEWFNKKDDTSQVIRAGIAHLWFVTIHPFEDGNGRIARALTDMLLARSEQSAQRFYSMSTQLRKERNSYYINLGRAQKGTLDITEQLHYFLETLNKVFAAVDSLLEVVLRKARFWQNCTAFPINDRQRKVLNALLNGFEGKLNTSKWAKIAKCSQDTAGRDIAGLVDYGILAKDPGGGRSTSYSIEPVFFEERQ